MKAIGFDNDKYIKLQSQKIQERISSFGGKLYLEFGGKLFDDYHASRVLPGFCPDSKIKMLLNMKDDAEVIIVVSATSIEQNKIRGDLGITYDMDTLRLIDAFNEIGIYVSGIVISQYTNQPTVDTFIKRLENLEGIANSFDGVDRSYAIQAGREIRIVVKPEKVKDNETILLAKDIVKKIEAEMEYPGQIKVNVIRETRAVDYAK